MYANFQVMKYSPDEKISGIIEYNKDNGMISQQEPIVSEFYPDEFFFKRSGRRLARMAILLNELQLNPNNIKTPFRIRLNGVFRGLLNFPSVLELDTLTKPTLLCVFSLSL